MQGAGKLSGRTGTLGLVSFRFTEWFCCLIRHSKILCLRFSNFMHFMETFVSFPLWNQQDTVWIASLLSLCNTTLCMEIAHLVCWKLESIFNYCTQLPSMLAQYRYKYEIWTQHGMEGQTCLSHLEIHQQGKFYYHYIESDLKHLYITSI